MSLRSEVTWKRSGPNWHGSLAGEKNRCLDLTIAPQNKDFYQTLGAHNRTTKSSNFGDSKQDFICDMFCFIQHGLTRVWLCFIPQDDRSLLGFCVFSFLLTHFTFGVCNLISKFGVAIAFYLKWWCLEMVVCIAQVSHSISGFGKYKWLFTMKRTEENGQLTCWKSDGSRTEGRGWSWFNPKIRAVFLWIPRLLDIDKARCPWSLAVSGDFPFPPRNVQTWFITPVYFEGVNLYMWKITCNYHRTPNTLHVFEHL